MIPTRLIIGILAIFVSNLQGQNFSWKKDSAVLEKLFERYTGNQPGISFIIVKNDTVLACKSYGLADLENKIPATPQTNYRTASVTKQFTAMAIMMLIEQGKIRYDSKLTDVFPDFPEYGKKVSIKDLLVHRSGLVDYVNLMEKGRTEQILDGEILKLMYQEKNTIFEPGTKYEYSNSGYAVLAEIIAKVSAMPFSEFMQKNIFQPLQMSETIVFEKDKNISNRAFGYVATEKGFELKDQSTTSAVQGDGGIYTSVLDYYKWHQALEKNILISKESFEKALIPVYDNPNLLVQKYGNGWRIEYINGLTISHHSGHTKGFTNYTLRIPELNFCFAAFSNRNNEDAIIRIGNAIAALFSEGKIPVPAEAFVEAVFDKEGYEKALEYFQELQKNNHYNFLFTEQVLNIVGAKLQKENKLKEALEVYHFNLEKFPSSFEICFQLANCYTALKEKKKAGFYYKKTMELMPEFYRNIFEIANKHAHKN